MPETVSFSLIMDVSILVLLGITIIYAARLSLYLKRFRDSKSDLETIVTDLSKQITKADHAIKTLNKTVDESGVDLQRRMDRANMIYDELEMIVQSGDNMASRLEALAVKNRKILEGGHSDLDDLAVMAAAREESYNDRLEGLVRQVGRTDDKDAKAGMGASSSVFAIRDPDVERGDDDLLGGFELNDEDQEVLSEAERDLYNTLKAKKKRAGRK